MRSRIAALAAVAFKNKSRLEALSPAVEMPTGITGKRLSARRGILLIGIYLTLDAEAGFEPARTLWALRAYETRELDRATLLRDKWQVVPVLPRTRFALEAKLHSWCPT